MDHNMLSITDPWSYHPWGGPGRGRFGGPFRGRGGRCGRGGRFGGHPYHGWGGAGCFVPPWCQGFGQGGACSQGKYGEKPAEQKGEEPMDTEQKPGPSEEERKTFLRGVGEAVSSCLEPFGVKVDVDVLGGAKDGADSKTADGATPAADVSTCDD